MSVILISEIDIVWSTIENVTDENVGIGYTDNNEN